MSGEFSLAVHAMVYLNHKGKTLSSEELAKNVCTNAARVRKVMAKLKRAGLVATKEGAEGGYYFDRDPKEITLRMIDEAVDIKLVSASWRSGNVDMKCLIASGMAGVMDDIYTKLDEQCKSTLESITIQDIDDKLFK